MLLLLLLLSIRLYWRAALLYDTVGISILFDKYAWLPLSGASCCFTSFIILQCCAEDSCCYTESFVESTQVLQPVFVPAQNQVLSAVQQVVYPQYPQNQAPGLKSILLASAAQRFDSVVIYQQPYGQQQLLQQVQPPPQVQQQQVQQQPQQIVNQGQTNPAANIDENVEANAPSTSETKEQF